MSCGVGQQLQLQFIPPAREFPYAAGVAIKEKEKGRKKKRKRERERKEGKKEKEGRRLIHLLKS